jgi:amidohydrolase
MPRSTDLLARLLEALSDELAAAVALRRRLHATPELAHAEHATSATVREALDRPTERAAGTGVVAQVGAGTAAVGVRAELDGLPIEERTGAPFASSNGAMHACGHDVHTAALVALVRAAGRIEHELPVPLVALFQPSEEAYPSGAELLAREPVIDGVSTVLAAHVHPELDWGAVALDPGPVNASSDTAAILVEGEGTHGAYPHLGADAVLALAHVIVAVHGLVGRRIDPLSAAVITVGDVHAGAAENVVAEVARARATLRALDPDDRQRLRDLVREVVERVSRAHRCRGSVSIVAGEPALVNDPATVAATLPLLAVAGFAAAPPWRSCGSDDLAFFGRHARLAMAFVGLRGAPDFQLRPLHNAEFLPPDQAVGAVARALAALYVGAASVVESV